MKIEESSIILTGGAGSLGQSICSGLVNEARHISLVDIDDSGIDRVLGEIPSVNGYCCDLQDPSDSKKIINQIFEDTPGINVLINNAGLISNAPLVNILNREEPELNFDDWDKCLRSNLYTTFLAGRSFASNMVKRRRKGIIVNISSISASGNAGQSAYSAAKAGVESMSKVWAKELSVFGIRSVAIAPGFFDTDSTRKSLSESQIKHVEKSAPSKRMGKIDELLDSLKFVIENDFFNGKVLHLDGGLVI